MTGSKEEFHEMREAEIAPLSSDDSFVPEFEFDDGKENYILSLLDNTVYSDEKKQHYESIIKSGLSQEEYNALKYLFLNDMVDNITMRGTGSMAEIKRALKRLK